MEDKLIEATQRLLDWDSDQAREINGIGYNKPDGAFIRYIKYRIGFDYMDSKTRLDVYNVLRKYSKTQLSDIWNQIEEPKLDTSFDEAIKVKVEKKKQEAFLKTIQSRRLVLNNDTFTITFDFDWNIVNAIRSTFNDKKYDSIRKVWNIKLTEDNISKLYDFIEKFKFNVDGNLEQAIYNYNLIQAQKEVEVKEVIELSRKSESNITVSNLKGTLKPFQKAGVEYAVKQKRTFIADEMGLGKTIQAIATIQHKSLFPALIICPASLKYNWLNEINNWLDGVTVEVLNGKSTYTNADITIINYDILKKHKDYLVGRNYKVMVADESHYVKNYKSIRTKTTKEISKDIEYILFLTGTPVLNRPNELISQLDIMKRLNDFGGFWSFARRYCNAFQDAYGWNLSGASNLEELNLKLRGNCYIRRNKKDVLTELPDKVRQNVYIDLTNKKEYDFAERDLVKWLKSIGEDESARKAMDAEQLVRIEKLKQLAVAGKMDGVFEWIDNVLEQDEKLVVFASHTKVVEAIANKYNCKSIYGGTDIKARQEAVDDFQNNPNTRLLVLNMIAGGVGLTLTASSNVAFIELGWTPAVHDQAEDRLHRIGQKDSVNVYYLLAKNSIDEEIMDLIEQKRVVVTGTTEGEDIKDVKVLNELVKKLIKK